MTPECEDLHSYADGELDPAKLPAFETHLVGCAGCQQDFRDLMQLAALGEEAAARAPARPRLLFLHRLRRPAPLMAMAAALLVSVVTVAMLSRLQPATGPELWLS
ncbi:MAG TPA: zf-HC2 domain-containing protein, partial [Myxococcales bacterium]|nr:zf-HC2 domain-containing protein [Myxococcales bacterium]